MDAREKQEAQEKKAEIIMRQRSRCYVCAKPFNSNNIPEAAHQLIKSKANLELFTPLVIHHRSNLKATCKRCNDRVIINRATQPVKAMEKVVDILSQLIEEGAVNHHFKQLVHAFSNVNYTLLSSAESWEQYEALRDFFKSLEQQQ